MPLFLQILMLYYCFLDDLSRRQPTPFDRICYQVETPSEGRLGSRVYGDCDLLMREIMKNILPPDDLQDWLDQKEARLAEYDTKRDTVEEDKCE